jgi:hypothetical protein
MFRLSDHRGKPLTDVGERVPPLVEQSGICADAATSYAGTNARKAWSLMDPEFEHKHATFTEN